MRINVKMITKAYLLVFFVLLMIYCSLNDYTQLGGELDDYALPSISIMYEHNLSVSSDDIENFKLIFPKWRDYPNSPYFNFSGYLARNGGELSWYFPLYSALAIPFILLLNVLGLGADYAYAYTNIACIMLMLGVVYKFMDLNDKRKLLLLVLLSANPIVYYMRWVSAEVLLYSLLGMSLVFWYNRAYKRAAVFISLAGMCNPAAMVVGMAIIADFFYNLFSIKQPRNFFKCIYKNIKDIIAFGSCFVLSLIPFCYNYYNTGHFNLTASYSHFTKSGGETVIQRFLAYLFDFNFGFLPYFGIILIVSLVLCVFALKSKQWKYLLMLGALFGTVFVYSIMTHINSGMVGIARYNAWASAILIFAVCCYVDKVVDIKAVQATMKALVTLSTVLVLFACPYYYSYRSISYVDMMPWTEWILDNIPQLYNPLGSTFNSRVMHVDGGYEYETPIVYMNSQGEVRKILANSDDKQQLLNEYCGLGDDVIWFEEQVETLGEKSSYISIPKSKTVVAADNHEDTNIGNQ